MWQGLTDLTQSLAEKATDLASEVGLENHLRIVENVINLDVGDDEPVEPQPTVHRSSTSASFQSDAGDASELRTLRQRLLEVETAAADALGELEDLREQLNASTQSKSLAEKEVQRLTRQLKTKQTSSDSNNAAEVDSLKSQIQKLQDELDVQRTRVESLKKEQQEQGNSVTEAQKAKDELQELKGKMAKAKKQYMGLKQQLTAAQQGQAESVAEVEKLKAELEQERQNAATVAASQPSPATIVENNNADELKASKAENEAKNKEITSLKSKVTELETKLKEAENKASTTSTAVSEKTPKESPAAKKNEQQHKAQVAALEEKHAQKLEDLNAKIVDLEADAAAKANQLKELQSAVLAKDSELAVLREGAKAENQLAKSSVKDAALKINEAEARVASLTSQLQSAQQAERDAVSARDALTAELRSARDAASEAHSKLEAHLDRIAELERGLERTKAGISDAISEAEERLQGEAAAKLQAAVQEARSAAMTEAEELASKNVEELTKKLEAAEKRAHEAQISLEELRQSTSAGDDLSQKTAAAQDEISQLKLQIEELQRELTESRTSGDKLLEEVEKLKAEGVERQKKFAVVQTGFKKKEQDFQEQLASVQAAAAAAQAAAADAAVRAGEATQVAENAEQAREDATRKAQDLESRYQTLEQQLESSQTQLASLTAQLTAATEELNQRVASAHALSSSIDSVNEQHKLKLEQALQEQETELRAVATSLERQLAEERGKLADADARASAAEAAKIELSLKLADFAASVDGEVDVDGRRGSTATTPTYRLSSTGELLDETSGKVIGNGLTTTSEGLSVEDSLLNRAEAAELAVAATTRRATAAEVKCDELKVALAEAEKKVSQLTWQVKMVSGGGDGGFNGGGNKEGRLGKVAAAFDLFGCAINADRRRDTAAGR